MKKLYIDGELIKFGDEVMNEDVDNRVKVEGPDNLLTESHLDTPGWIKGIHYHDVSDPDSCRCPECTYTMGKGPDHIKFIKYTNSREIVKDIMTSKEFAMDFITVIPSEIEDARYNGTSLSLERLIKSLFVTLNKRIKATIKKASIELDEEKLWNLEYVELGLKRYMTGEYLTYSGNPLANKVQAQVAISSKSMENNV